MHEGTSQLVIDQLIFPYDKLGLNNRRTRMAGLVLWNEAEKACAEGFGKTGAPAHPVRMALSAGLIYGQLLARLAAFLSLPHMQAHHIVAS